MAFQGNSDRFDPTGYKHVDRLAHKGRSKQRQNNIPYATETKTPSKQDLYRGLSELGIKISPQQLEKLRSMGGSEVLKSIVTLGTTTNSSTAPPAAPSTSGTYNQPPKHSLTGQTYRKNSTSVDGLLRMPDAEANRSLASGDDQKDQDRVVTGLQSDKHRHFEHRQIGRKKTEIRALQTLKACGPDPATIYKKLLTNNKKNSSNKGILSKEALRQGMTEIAGIQLSPADYESVVKKLDPQMKGKEGITLRQFSQILSKIPSEHRAKTTRQARQHHIDTINLTNKKAVDPVQVEISGRAAVISGIDQKLSKRFGTEPNR